MLNTLLQAFVVAGFSYTWCRVLTAPGMILHFVRVLVSRIRDQRVRDFVAKPVYACPVCNSFHLAFLYFFGLEEVQQWAFFFPAVLFFSVLILRTEQ